MVPIAGSEGVEAGAEEDDSVDSFRTAKSHQRGNLKTIFCYLNDLRHKHYLDFDNICAGVLLLICSTSH